MIQGEIHTLPLPDLIQWLALTRRTGKLIIAQGGDNVERYLDEDGGAGEMRPSSPNLRLSVEVYFAEGEIVGAAISAFSVSDTVEKVRATLRTALTWRSGRFAFLASPLPDWVLTAKLRLPAETLLLEVAAERSLHQPPEVEPGLGEWFKEEEHSETFTLADALRLQVVDQLMKEDFSVPAMPQLAARVLELTRDENFSMRELSNLVLKDQAVTARVLRYANSVLRGGSREVDSLALAVQRLGADEVVNIVLAASLQARRLGQDRFAAEKQRVWVHSLTAAFLARALAARVGLNSNLGFLCGMLMDFGMTVLYSLIQDVLTRRAKPEPVPPQVIAEIVHDYHSRIGRFVGEKWRLHPMVVEAMAYHHCLEASESENPYVAVAALADSLATYALGRPRAALEASLAEFPPEQLVAHPAAQFIQLNLNAAAAVLAGVPQNLDQALKCVVD